MSTVDQVLRWRPGDHLIDRVSVEGRVVGLDGGGLRSRASREAWKPNQTGQVDGKG